MANLILPKIQKALQNSFVKWEKVAEVLSLSLTMQKPCLLYGRGGHGKSEMVRAVFKALAETTENIFIQSFGEGMTEAKLFGGLDMKALNDPENPKMRFCPQDSFLPRKYVLFEELFDAPPVVLLALKDTLMDKKLNNGAQVFPMSTELLVGATNKDPVEISDLGDSAHALVERFPLQLSVEWDTYEQKDFVELFDKVQSKSPVILGSSLKGIIAQLIAEAHAKGEWISPRQAVVCADAVRASAIINNRDEATEDDLIGIQFIPGTQGVLADMDASLKRIKAVAEAENQLCGIEAAIAAQKNAMESRLTPIKYLQVVKRLQKAEDSLNNLKLPDELIKRRNDARQQCTKLISEAQDAAIQYTLV